MATYYVDYENVHNGGMKGIEEVRSNDLVYVFYSAVANTMTMETIQKLLQLSCAIEFIETSNGTANSLDFQLITLLYSTIDSDDYHYIISNDKGFDASISMAKRININSVIRFNTIYGAMKDYEKHLAEYAAEQETEAETTNGTDTTTLPAGAETDNVEIVPVPVVIAPCTSSETSDYVQKLLEQQSELTLSQEKLDITCEGIIKSSTKAELYKYLRHNLGDKDGRLIYGAVCDSWGDLVAMAS